MVSGKGKKRRKKKKENEKEKKLKLQKNRQTLEYNAIVQLDKMLNSKKKRKFWGHGVAGAVQRKGLSISQQGGHILGAYMNYC